eukprot:gene7601-biopygen8169
MSCGEHPYLKAYSDTERSCLRELPHITISPGRDMAGSVEFGGEELPRRLCSRAFTMEGSWMPIQGNLDVMAGLASKARG